MSDDPAPDAPTPPQGVPRPYYPPAPLPPPVGEISAPQGGYGAPQQPSPWGGGYPSYLDTPTPVVSKAEPVDKPPADFDG